MKTHARLFRLLTVIALFLSIGIYGQSPAAPPLETTPSVPLVTGTTLVGTLTLYSSAPAFTDAQSRLVQTIAPHIARAIHTARHARSNADVPSAAAKMHAAGGQELRLVGAR